MNSCPQADKIINYCLDQLTEEEKIDFLLHLDSCATCQHELALEKAIENELAQEFDPGFIENKIRVRLQLWRAQNMRSFWLYAFRMVVCGITAAIAGFILIPLLLDFLLGTAPKLGQYAHGIGELVSGLAPGNEFYIVLGISFIAIFAVSVYSLVQIRR